eukprot:5287830-Amphidinium_carterae.1
MGVLFATGLVQKFPVRKLFALISRDRLKVRVKEIGGDVTPTSWVDMTGQSKNTLSPERLRVTKTLTLGCHGSQHESCSCVGL